MKKLLCIVLCVLTIASIAGCSSNYSVPNPMVYPDYTFDEEPDATQMRQTAVKAMRDILSIQWCTKKEIRYRKTGPVSNKEFLHEPGNTYAGLLYSNASSGIFQYFEYYNLQTGCLEYPGTADEMKLDLGCSCADSLLWGWSTVCNSVTGGFYPVMMVPANGYLPVGDYTIPEKIKSYNEMPSYAIIENTPKDVMLDAYSKTLPADALISNSDNHAMMVIEAPVVVHKSNGEIDAENSYLMIQDQRAGGTASHKEVVNGETIAYNGRISAKYTFQKLYEEDYIPVTAKEFIGEKSYDKAAVTVSNPNCKSLSELKDITVESNYPLAVINIIGEDASGKTSVLSRTLFGGSSMHGVPRSYQLADNKELENLTTENGCTVKLEVVLSTGERFYPIEFTI